MRNVRVASVALSCARTIQNSPLNLAISARALPVICSVCLRCGKKANCSRGEGRGEGRKIGSCCCNCAAASAVLSTPRVFTGAARRERRTNANGVGGRAERRTRTKPMRCLYVDVPLITVVYRRARLSDQHILLILRPPSPTATNQVSGAVAQYSQEVKLALQFASLPITRISI